MKSKDKAQLSLFEIEAPSEQKKGSKFQYLIVVSPSEEIKQKVLEMKQTLNGLVPISAYNLRSTPHISITGFAMAEQLDNDFWDKFQLLFSKVPRFAVSLNGFENFMHGQISNTLYIKIDDPKPFILLHKMITHFFRINERNYEPHLTVARTLPREALPKINEFIGQHEFKAKFKCTNLTILERSVEGKTTSAYKVCRQIQLQDV
ncbi:MAG: 2'-5' RNA ligase family protein [Bacteroidetes bacterium]|nr:2'-5' RNA ligase family protein [Bacteroidota bacterium]